MWVLRSSSVHWPNWVNTSACCCKWWVFDSVSANYSHWSDKAICTFILLGGMKINLNHSIISNMIRDVRLEFQYWFFNRKYFEVNDKSWCSIDKSTKWILEGKERDRFYWFDIAASDVYFIGYMVFELLTIFASVRWSSCFSSAFS